jgi:leukotriene-A4 hydrolase
MKIFFKALVISTICASFLISCHPKMKKLNTPEPVITNHSFGNSDAIKIKHIQLNLEVDFDQNLLHGNVVIDYDNVGKSEWIVLDHRAIDIHKVTTVSGEPLEYEIGASDPHLGAPLFIKIGEDQNQVVVHYATRQNCPAVQWLKPSQTNGKKYPFLFTQSQAILARTWVPLMDAPSTRFTYDANIKCPKELMALMSASNPTEKSEDGNYHFDMPQPIPSYLMALSVGDVEYTSLGDSCGVYAEPGMMEKSVYEFTGLDKMIASAESLYGDYRWGKYDLLVLPASFPFGGMENPRLTFATPTIITGDRSLVALVAHELAHSWSGNLVTNSTWNDFWLNEGFTVYFEQRIMEEIYGKDYADMESENGYGELLEEIAEISEKNENDTKLFLELDGRDPDDGMTSIAYEKGRFFLRMIEETVGRENWDEFLNKYFNEHAFQTMTTETFISYLNSELLDKDPGWKSKVNVEEWIYQPGLPKNCPVVKSSLLDNVRTEIATFEETKNVEAINSENWTTHQWLYFFRNTDKAVLGSNLAELDSKYSFTNGTNSEMLCDWFKHCIENDYEPAYGQLRTFLTEVGRRKFLQPLYVRLAKTEKGKEFGKSVFEDAKDGYHSVSRNTIEGILFPSENGAQ